MCKVQTTGAKHKLVGSCYIMDNTHFLLPSPCIMCDTEPQIALHATFSSFSKASDAILFILSLQICLIQHLFQAPVRFPCRCSIATYSPRWTMELVRWIEVLRNSMVTHAVAPSPLCTLTKGDSRFREMEHVRQPGTKSKTCGTPRRVRVWEAAAFLRKKLVLSTEEQHSERHHGAGEYILLLLVYLFLAPDTCSVTSWCLTHRVM